MARNGSLQTELKERLQHAPRSGDTETGRPQACVLKGLSLWGMLRAVGVCPFCVGEW